MGYTLYSEKGLPRWLSGKESTCQSRRLQFGSLGRENPLEKKVATHFSILAWRIPVVRGAWWAIVLQVAKSRT